MSTLWEMSHYQLEQYFRKHRKKIDRLWVEIEKSEGKRFRKGDLFRDLLDGYTILETLFKEHDDYYQKKVKVLEDRVRELEKRLHLGPENSHMPPSSSRFKKIKNQRVKTGKPIGGQKGHPGVSPDLIDTPDQVHRHEAQKCRSCGRPLKEVKDAEVDRRQIVDIKDGQPFITEHQRVTKYCPDCGEMNRGSVPEDAKWMKAKKIFGPALRSIALYFMGYQLIPVARTQEILSDLFGLSVAQGSLCNFMKDASFHLNDWEISQKSQLIHSNLLHTDETGARCEKRNDWVHVLGNDQATLLFAHKSRGADAQNDFGVLPEYKGHLVRDGFKSYDQFTKCTHSFCNAHILRELKFLFEEEKQKWAFEFSEFLKRTLHRINLMTVISKSFQSKIKQEYRRLLRSGFRECGYEHEYKGRPPDWIKKTWEMGKRIRIPKYKRRKMSRAMNLLARLRDHMPQVMLFAFDKKVPFTNNQAERDLRMLKVKEKVSGCFRSQGMEKDFLRFRSFLSTLRKQQLHLLDNIYLLHVIKI
jgi:transposase